MFSDSPCGSKSASSRVVHAGREKALPKWSTLTACNRGQVLYRVAEIMEGRRAQFAELVGGEAEVDEAIDSWVWYAGWADKLAQVFGSSRTSAASDRSDERD